MNLHLKIARMKKNLTQKEVAKRIGITSKYLSQLETDSSSNPSKPVMKKIAEALDCSVQELFFYDDNERMV